MLGYSRNVYICKELSLVGEAMQDGKIMHAELAGDPTTRMFLVVLA